MGENIEIRVVDVAMEIESKSRLITQCINWGKNRRNVVAFLEQMPAPVLRALDSARASTGVPVASTNLAVTERRE